MKIDLEQGKWFCFGCNLSGDAYRFVRHMFEKQNGWVDDLCAYQEYMRILKSDRVSGIKLEGHWRPAKLPERELYNQAYDHYHGLSRTNWEHPEASEAVEAKAYMQQRGFSASTLAKCKAKVNYDRHYGLIFPMLDNGKFKGWVCRTMIKRIEEERKYLYNTGFSRASTLVGDYGSSDYVIVVEGYMDRLKFIQFGYDNVVAILGWKMSQNQIEKLKSKGIKWVISALDNDKCGKQGTEWLKRYFSVTRWQYLKGIKDPGDMEQESFTRMFNRTMQRYKAQRKVRKD